MTGRLRALRVLATAMAVGGFGFGLFTVVFGIVNPVLYAVVQAELQRTDHVSEHAAFFHWVEMALYAAAIPLLGLLAGLRPQAYRMAARCTAVALLILGVASLVFGAYASALPADLAWAAAVGGAAFFLVAEAEARRQEPSG